METREGQIRLDFKIEFKENTQKYLELELICKLICKPFPDEIKKYEGPMRSPHRLFVSLGGG